MPKTSEDINILKSLPDIHIWGEDFEQFGEIKLFKGKFVITDEGKFIAKIVPKEKYDKMDIYHNTMLFDLGVKDPDSKSVHNAIVGGGKMELEMVGDYIECRLYGGSKTYGDFDKTDIDLARMEKAIESIFHLGMMPILVIPDFDKVTAKI